MAWTGVRKNTDRKHSGIEASTPTFRLQEYLKTGILLIQRLDRNKQVCRISIDTNEGLRIVGDFRPEDYHAISWSHQVSEVTIHVQDSNGDVILQQPIVRR